MRKVKILIFETSDFLRPKMANAIVSLSHVGMTMLTGDFKMVVSTVAESRPDVVIMHIAQAQARKAEIAALKSGNPGVNLLLHSEFIDEEFSACAIELGADIFVDFMRLVEEVAIKAKGSAGAP